MVNTRDAHKQMVRLPDDAKAFIVAQSNRNGSSQNSEIIRCIRDRMESRGGERTEAVLTGSPEQASAVDLVKRMCALSEVPNA